MGGADGAVRLRKDHADQYSGRTGHADVRPRDRGWRGPGQTFRKRPGALPSGENWLRVSTVSPGAVPERHRERNAGAVFSQRYGRVAGSGGAEARWTGPPADT